MPISGKMIVKPDGNECEEKALTRLWESKGMLVGIEDERLKTEIALCLESQRVTMLGHAHSVNLSNSFKHHAISLLLRTLKASTIFPEKPFFMDRYLCFGDYDEYVFPFRYNPPTQCKWTQFSLEKEKAYIGELAERVGYAFDMLLAKTKEDIAFDSILAEPLIVDGRIQREELLVLRYKKVIAS